ncbi:hypothetical protein U0038_08230 [Sphingobacterium spiritivorum]|uniref:ApeA N-terminal domain-containing protein n=1 Tax=Sphingobacterium spiritivorum ATCC 33861 TaxID=525373 RepID=D7VGF9_SPHSI|nr:hypothetical protein [Sphingobacterium spiritivorum]MCT4329174.1 hypothetical protein [Elizabethkingia anophelis]EFK60134.1 hypothetical protein HMPREF0766_10078 [Sphingobacterium spiritivorum ATCC 33861]QQT34841.1 hypothetical protein I6J01_16280 [Sphingobacterium spiritivorum]WQD35731.1 hypothetical protein U0038_08230 [Sphingobacterium spiritivorum]SUJ01738.1 Uncharacterised protein [Sphingobacterium spiritivorum]
MKKTSSTRNTENFKDFDKQLEFIEKINSFDEFQIFLSEYLDHHVFLSKRGKKFYIDTDFHMEMDEANEISKFVFPVDDVMYETKDLHCISRRSDFKKNEGSKHSATFEVNSLQSQCFHSKSLFTTFFPVELKEIKSFHGEFETIVHKRNRTTYGYDCLLVNINGVEYHITQLKTVDNGFYVFECLQKETFENYRKVCFSIQQAIGFINGLMVGDEEYIFDSAGNLYFSNEIRQKIRSMYNPIITNPYSYLDIDREIAKDYIDKLTSISFENLSNLVSRIHTDEDFSTAILVILDASYTRSLLLVPSSFAVIIELLSKNIDTDSTEVEIPIENKALKNKIISELHTVIDNNSSTLSEAHIIKLKRRLNDINKPVSKRHLTNNEKLTRPFERLGIKLSLRDIEIIEHRNDLLHGNILMKKDNKQSDDSINLYMSYVSARLFTLISKLLLKSIGYNGYVYNQAKYLEKYMNINTDEEYFEKI